MVRGRVSKWLWLGLTLVACGGRTIDDGNYGIPGTGSGNPDGSCSYKGVTVANGALLADPCICFCSSGQFLCQDGCAGPGSTVGAGAGGYSSGGPMAGGAGAPSAGAPSAGAPSAGAPSAGAPSAGAAGTAGSPPLSCGAPLRASGASALIDDMEDANRYILMAEGRRGNWFTYNDGSPGAVQHPDPASSDFAMFYEAHPFDRGKYVARTEGHGFDLWGAGMGLVLSASCPYDASNYAGVSFLVRSDSPLTLTVLLPTAQTNPPGNGGTCQELTGHSCFDAYQVQIDVIDNWQEYFIGYDMFTQQGWGTPVAFDPKALIGINFQVSTSSDSFAFEIDDLAFF